MAALEEKKNRLEIETTIATRKKLEADADLENARQKVAEAHRLAELATVEKDFQEARAKQLAANIAALIQEFEPNDTPNPDDLAGLD